MSMGMQRTRRGIWRATLLLVASQMACGWLWPRDKAAEEKLLGDGSIYEASGYDGDLRAHDAGEESARESSAADLGTTCPGAGSRRCEEGGGEGSACWIRIPPGTFTMGSPSSEECRLTPAYPEYGYEDEHTVVLTHAFEIQETEVTQLQFAAKMKKNPSSHASCPACPVESVNWHVAAAYCNALSAELGLPFCYECDDAANTCTTATAYEGENIYDCPGYRLPTEAEWEYAYRACSTAAYYNGKSSAGECGMCQADADLSQIGWYCGNADGATHPVQELTPNSWGLYDMAGNVWEWCHDPWQQRLGTAAVTDPVGQESTDFRATRGGGFAHAVGTLRAALRSFGDQGVAYPDTGFRCVRAVP